jgi:hypothetical protein
MAAAIALAGCSSPGGGAAGPASPVPAADRSLTIAQAQTVYDNSVTKSTAAAARGDAAAALAIAGDAQWSILHAQYAALAATGTPVTRYSYGTPTFYVPGLAQYPEWFVVSVPVATVTGTRRPAPASTVMAFQRLGATRPWTLVGQAVLDRPLPAIARDRDGYAISVANGTQSLVLPPNIVGPTQAAVVDEGPTAPAAAAIASGPQTTGLYAAQVTQDQAYTTRGLNYLWLLEGASLPLFSLQTANGGAVVIYSMYLNTTIEHPGNVFGPPIPVPANFSPLVKPRPTLKGNHGINANWTFEFAAVDPPSAAAGAKAVVIGGTGAPTYGDAY